MIIVAIWTYIASTYIGIRFNAQEADPRFSFTRKAAIIVVFTITGLVIVIPLKARRECFMNSRIGCMVRVYSKLEGSFASKKLQDND